MALEDLAQALASSLEQAKLVPGSAASIIPQDFKPTTELSVKFNGRSLDLGNLFRSSECKSAPSISFSAEVDATSQASYLLLLVDPDAPTPDDPKFAFWRHWVLPGLQVAGGEVQTVTQTKDALTEYLGPGPKDDSKPHRYLFLLFREPVGLSLAKEDVGGEEFVQRRSFEPTTFIEKNQLQLVGLNWMLGAGDGWKE
ncbi:phosphatidylethanolamine-binding protein [Ilyonectria sp. MPI-CAGE-AT-0026]|nr:phosphatidylethanolamine-binding protein [Ilyonectria sp. MPI-CAGE-AT-0026]